MCMCIEWDAKRTKLDLEPVDGGQCLADRIMNSRLFVCDWAYSLFTPSEITLEDHKLLIVILQDKMTSLRDGPYCQSPTPPS